MSTRNEFKLMEEIVALSVSDVWSKAKFEWELETIYFLGSDEAAETCLCGHYPIRELCILRNIKNNKTTTVGNVCVTKFIGLPAGVIFRSVENIKKSIHQSLNRETIEYAYSKGIINDWELKFYADTMRKRKLSDKQRSKRTKINQKILDNVVKDIRK